MKKTVLASLMLLTLPWTPLSLSRGRSAEDPDTTVINRFIAKQKAREHGEEYEDARKVAAGDLNHDGTPDLAVLYTIEGQNGTNRSAQYLAVFIRTKGALIPLTYTAVGGKSGRGIELVSITDNVINLKTMDYGPKDPSCCPSKEGKTQYTLVGGKLKELRQGHV
jgi:hypothetical protein